MIPLRPLALAFATPSLADGQGCGALCVHTPTQRRETMTTAVDMPTADHGSVLFIPLNRLKKSPRNARKTPHSADAIEALAASIAAKGMLQSPVVEPECDEAGSLTGNYLVTIGEGRRQAQLLRVKRNAIKRSEPVRCLIDLANDAHEISLDENVTRSAMHPADQFEAFHRLAEERGLGAEDIAARFGVTATVVRQRLRLAGVSPRLMEGYREGALTLDQLMAFTVSEDHARQEGVWESLPSYDRSPYAIRRHLTRDRVSARDRRAIFVGIEAYQEAGGAVERDLFAEDSGDYFADPALLDRLVRDKLQSVADEVTADGWKWASLDTEPGLRRIRPMLRDRTSGEDETVTALRSEQEALQATEEWTDECEARYQEIVRKIDEIEAVRLCFDPDDMAKAGAFVTLGETGQARVDYGFVRTEDEKPEAEPDTEGSETGDVDAVPSADDLTAEKGRAPLSDKLVADLTAHRTMALRDALATQPKVALIELLHALVMRTFEDCFGERNLLEIRPHHTVLSQWAAGIEESPAGRAVRERHETWAVRLVTHEEGPRSFIMTLSDKERLSLLAHCVSLTVNAVASRDRDWAEDDAASDLARNLSLDMTAYWQPTAETYFSRVSKSRIVEAVSEAGSPDVARRLEGAKKDVMAESAEALITGTGWLPEPLRFGAEQGDKARLAAE